MSSLAKESGLTVKEIKVPDPNELIQDAVQKKQQADRQLIRAVFLCNLEDAREAAIDRIKADTQIECLDAIMEWLGAWQMSIMTEPDMTKILTDAHSVDPDVIQSNVGVAQNKLEKIKEIAAALNDKEGQPKFTRLEALNKIIGIINE